MPEPALRFDEDLGTSARLIVAAAGDGILCIVQGEVSLDESFPAPGVGAFVIIDVVFVVRRFEPFVCLEPVTRKDRHSGGQCLHAGSGV